MTTDNLGDVVLLGLQKAAREAREMYLAAGMRNVFGLSDRERLGADRAYMVAADRWLAAELAYREALRRVTREEGP